MNGSFQHKRYQLRFNKKIQTYVYKCFLFYSFLIRFVIIEPRYYVDYMLALWTNRYLWPNAYGVEKKRKCIFFPNNVPNKNPNIFIYHILRLVCFCKFPYPFDP